MNDNEMKWIDVFDIPNITKTVSNKIESENIEKAQIGDFYEKQEPGTNKKPEIRKPKISELKKEEIEKLLLEGIEIRRNASKEKIPGDYEIGFNCRGKLLNDKKCYVCNEGIEAIYTVHYSEPMIFGPGGGGRWILSKYRCSKCKIIYDFKE